MFCRSTPAGRWCARSTSPPSTSLRALTSCCCSSLVAAPSLPVCLAAPCWLTAAVADCRQYVEHVCAATTQSAALSAVCSLLSVVCRQPGPEFDGPGQVLPEHRGRGLPSCRPEPCHLDASGGRLVLHRIRHKSSWCCLHPSAMHIVTLWPGHALEQLVSPAASCHAPCHAVGSAEPKKPVTSAPRG